MYNNKSVCWITQLVVHREYRERGLAAGLLNELKENDDDIYGLMSSHPAACVAAARIFGGEYPLQNCFVNAILTVVDTINAVKLGFIGDHAEGIMKASPISYVKDAELRGSLFGTEGTDGAVSCVDTDFFVDHTEPLEALALVRETVDWPLGELLDGHEYILILEARRRARSTSRPRPTS